MANLVHVETVVGEIVDSPMTPEEARACLGEIHSNAASIRRKLLELYEREGWKALGYSSWRDCVTAEFSHSQSWVYYQLDAAKTARSLSTIVENPDAIPESHLRPLASLPPEQQAEAYQKALEIAPGRLTAKHVEEAAKAISPSPTAAGKRLDNPEAHNEHYTPDRILDAVYTCLGAVDLDPCCNPGEPNVKAAAHYRREDDGLRRTWRGRVFANPPYSPTGELGRWTEWLLRQYREGSVTEAIYLVPAYTDTQWWYELRDFPVCLVRGRLTFKGNTDPARYPSAVFYLGPNASAFGDAFAHLGDFWMRTLLED
jgi:hypothetical protein